MTKIRGTQIKDGTVDSGQLKNGAVTATKIASGAVTNAKIADGAVGGQKIVDNGVLTDKIADGAVTRDKIAEGAVDNDRIADQTIGPEKLNFEINATPQLFQMCLPITFSNFMMIGGEKFHYWPVGDGIATIASGCNGDMFIAENGVLARIGYTDSDAYFFGRAVSEPPPMSEPSSWYVYPNQVERNGAFGNTLELVYLYRRESFTSELTVEDQFLLFGLLVGSNEFIQPL